jgi:uncharacterized protein involved in exopolysaccharide biosynthesis
MVRPPESGFWGDLDVDKLYTVLRKSWLWILLIVFITNLGAYLFIRYTKPIYESYSDLKLNIKNDASLLGFLEVNEDQNLTNLSGEIELLKSKLFFEKVIRTLDLNVSYYTVGNILEDEKYRSPPFTVDYQSVDNWTYDKNFTLSIVNREEFILGYPENTGIADETYRFDQPIVTEHFSMTVSLNQALEEIGKNQLYSFRLNSARSLSRYLEENLKVEPLNLTANTIRISFRDHNRYKARDLVNAIDTIYLKYSKEQKNKANKQKIDFLDTQLALTQDKLQDYEQYFESFTIQNKTTDVQTDLSNTIKAIAQLDSQRLVIQRRISEVQQSQTNLQRQSTPEGILSLSNYSSEINDAFSQLDQLIKERELMLVSYNEIPWQSVKRIRRSTLANLIYPNCYSSIGRNLKVSYW